MTNNDLATELRRFVDGHPEGWNHGDWLGFLHALSEGGHDTSDGDAIGLALETERLSRYLEGMKIKGLGPKRIAALAGHFGTLWNLRSASLEELAQLPKVPRAMAEQILEALR